MNNSIKVIVLIIVLMIMPFSVIYGQKKCKYSYEKRDEFTGKTTVGIITQLKGTSFLMSTDGEAYALSFSLNFPGIVNCMIMPGDTLMIALENAPPLIFIATTMSRSSSNILETTVYSSLEGIYSATLEQIEMLAKTQPTAVRLFVNKNSQYYGYSIPEKKRGKLSSSAACIANYQK